MARYRKSKTDTTYFQDIPKQDKQTVTTDAIFRLLKEKTALKSKKTVLVEQQQETRKTIYNLSMKITDLEDEIDDMILRGGF